MLSFFFSPASLQHKGASVEERPVTNPPIGSLRNDDDDGDGNEDSKKAIGLDKQSNKFARASRFFSAIVA